MNKKVKKGFTLIELLGTIVILGIIVTIVIVVIMSIIKNSKKNTYVLTETNIVSTALTYAKENSGSFYSDDGSDIEYQCITVQELIDLGYFKKDITDSVIEFNNGTLNIDPDMRIYVDRNIETKVYGEGKLIKSQDDVLTQSCAFLDILKCPEIDSYNGIYDGESHKINLNYLNSGLEVNYKTIPTDPWSSTEPTRTDAGNTQVFVQVVNQVGQHKYCSNGNINITKKDLSVAWSGGSNFTYTGEDLGPTAQVDSGTGEVIELTSTKYKEVGTHTSTASCVSVDGNETKCNNFNLTNASKEFTIEVQVVEISLPTNAYCINRTYNGEEQVLTTDPGEGFTFSNNRKTNAGTYTVTASLEENYKWNDGTTTPKTFNCSITKKDISVSWGEDIFTYDGTPKGPTATGTTGIANETITLDTTKYTEVGTHTSTASCTNVTNSSCDNYELTNKTKNFIIEEPIVIVNIPTNAYCISRTYNGNEQLLTSTPAAGYTFSNNRKTNAGSYTVTATLEENYMWSDNTTTPKTFNCSITKKDISVSWSGDTFTYNGNPQGPTATADTGTGETIELVAIKFTEVGTHTSTASCVKVNNDTTKCNNYELTNKTKTFTIENQIVIVNIPTNAYCISRTYNGTEQLLTSTPAAGYTFSNNIKTNVGSYTITATLEENYMWSDNTTTPKTFNCSITKKDISVSWSGGTSFTYNGTEQGPTATATTGVTNETISLTATKYTDVGTHTSTASCVKVNNDTTKCNNYELTNKTRNFTINPKVYYLTFNLNGFSEMKKDGVTYTSNTTFSCEAGTNNTCIITAPTITNGYWKQESTEYPSGSSITVTESLNGKTLYANRLLISTPIPTSTYCDNKTYNGTSQVLTNTPATGYTFSNNNKTEAGTYTITASLKDGYIWSDNTETDKTFTCTISKKELSVSWSNETEFVYTGSQIGPTASVSTGITSETMSVSSTKEIDRGTYTSEASCQSVTGGGSSCDNYELTNTTKEYTIKRWEYFKYSCQASTGYYCSSGQILWNNTCIYSTSLMPTVTSQEECLSPNTWIPGRGCYNRGCNPATAIQNCGGKCSVGVCNCTKWGQGFWSDTDCGNKSSKVCKIDSSKTRLR